MVPGYREDVPYEIIDDECSAAEREAYWNTGVALQQVDGLQVSPYAVEIARDYISGKTSLRDLESSLVDYHAREKSENRQAEADIVAARIASLLEGDAFVLRPSQLVSIHSVLFDGLLPTGWVGKTRTENIRKSEPVLAGRSVVYADWRSVSQTLEYDFEQEKAAKYSLPMDDAQISRFARFIAHIWQTHAFREGNTRTVAVFSELYLRSLGVEVSNDPFIENSLFYRDALARASYSSMREGIDEDYSFITLFYESVITGERHDLSNVDLALCESDSGQESTS